MNQDKDTFLSEMKSKKGGNRDHSVAMKMMSELKFFYHCGVKCGEDAF